MTEPEIDDLLAAWNSRLGVAAQNLVDLRAHPCYQRLLFKTDLAGFTLASVNPVLEGMGSLFEHYNLIRRVVAQAEKLRADMSSFFGGAEQRVREIEFYLKGKSIRLAPVQVVPGDNNNLISPGELLTIMEDGFQKAHDVVLSVDKAWNLLPQAAADAGRDLADLRQNGILLNELAAAEAALRPLRDKIENDPLSAQQDMDTKVRPVLLRVRTLLDEMKRDQEEIEATLRLAQPRLDEVTKVHADAVAAQANATAKLSDCPDLACPASDSSLQDLHAWMARLDQKYHQGLGKPVLVGLRNWNKAADLIVNKDREALSAIAGMLEQRTELRGRLDALKAKARARGFAESAALLELSQQARDLLYSRPTPMRRAADLVSQYEGLLNGLKGTS